MSRRAVSALDLKEACIVASREFIAEHGFEQLSLRAVGRRLGVSHQAPYKHHPSRDHLLAEVMRRCFRGFAQFLEARQAETDPAAMFIWSTMHGFASLQQGDVMTHLGLSPATRQPVVAHVMPRIETGIGLLTDATKTPDDAC